MVTALALLAALTAGSPVPGSQALAPHAPARVTVYPVSRRREGAWQLQRIALEGEFLPSLGATLTEALPDSLLSDHEREVMAWDIAGLLRWDVDFARGLDDGDRYAIMFERFLGEHGEVRYGRVLAIELDLGRQHVAVYAFDAPDGRIVYYDAEGRSLERSYLSAPVDFKRITSGFSRARFHPVLHRWRAHQGIDYDAASGAPVRSVADGEVLRAGWVGGYGRLVEIRHAGGVVTRYGHLSRFTPGLKPGVRVNQGDVIGAVGSSGLATGPHLHFELRINGAATDPRFLPRESGTPIAELDRVAFVLQREQLRRYLTPQEPAVALQAGN